MEIEPIGGTWLEAIDVCEHHCIDFDAVAAGGVDVVIVRAGRGTRQDARWIEHVRAARTSGLSVGSYWHLYPSHTSAHHQAELWAAAARGAAPWQFSHGHWADISRTDGFDPFDLGRYVAAFLRRADELFGHQVGLFTGEEFWRRHVQFDDPVRQRWQDGPGGGGAAFGVRVRPADRGGPGRHRVRAAPRRSGDVTPAGRPSLVARGPTESLVEWRARWIRTPAVTYLQVALNALGAELVVDGVYGPATDAAVRTCSLLCRRDRIAWPVDVCAGAPTEPGCTHSSSVISRTRASRTSSAGRLSPPSGMITSA